jgi:multiple antibiotic resistance protein
MVQSAVSLALIVQFFVLINPLSSFPVLMEAYRKKMNVRAIAVGAVITAFFIAIIIALIGPYLFSFFGITVDSFRIAGGIVLLLLGLDTVRSKKEQVEVTKVDSIISIIATPLLTGPATISFVTIKAYELGRFATIVNLLGAFFLVGAVFIAFSRTIPKVNPKVVNIASKVLGLFLTAVAIEMIAKGVQAFL